MERLIGLVVAIALVIAGVSWVIDLITTHWVTIVSFILAATVLIVLLLIAIFTLKQLWKNIKDSHSIGDFFKRTAITLAVAVVIALAILWLWAWLEGKLRSQEDRADTREKSVKEFTKKEPQALTKKDLPQEPKKVVKKIPQPPKGWIWVKVPLNNGDAMIYEVMENPVTEHEVLKNSIHKPITNISFDDADKYCMDQKSRLMKSFVFQQALDQLKRPDNSIRRELTLPYDEEEDEIYYQEDKTIKVDGEKILLFDWDKKSHKQASLLFKSDNTTFRCMHIRQLPAITH